MNKTKSMLKKIDGILALLLGFVVLFNPFSTFGILMTIVGIVITISGASRIWQKLQAEKRITVNQILIPIIGVSLILTNDQSRYIVGWLLGGILLYNGAKLILLGKHNQTAVEKQFLSGGVVLAGIGLIIALIPGVLVFILTSLLGILLILYGVVRVWIIPLTIQKFTNLDSYKQTREHPFFHFSEFDPSKFKSYFNHDVIEQEEDVIDVDSEEK